MSTSTTGYTAEELRAWLMLLEPILRAAAEPFAVFGGVAVMHYGRRARTVDVDFLVDGTLERLSELAAAAGLVVERKSDWHRRLWAADRSIYADVVLADTDLTRSAVRGARTGIIADVELPIVPPEALVALKVIAARPRDLRDVADVLENTTVDREAVNALLAPYELTLPVD